METTTFEKVGEFSPMVARLLNLSVPAGTEILLSKSTLEHIKNDHPEISQNHKGIITDIIADPSVISRREKDGSIGFFKEYESGEQYYLELSVRASSVGEFFVRTLHKIHYERLNRYAKKNKIIYLDKLKSF